MRLILIAVSAASAGALAIAAQAPPAGGAIEVTAHARARQPGELVVLTVRVPTGAGAPRVRAFDRPALPYEVSANTWNVLVGIDLETKPGTYPVAIDAGSGRMASHATYDLAVAAKSFPTRKLTVDEAFVNPPASAEARIQRDAATLAAVWQHSSNAALWRGEFARPVPNAANSAFGTRSVYNGQPRSPHSGADFLSPAGTPVKAPNAGAVVLAEDLYYTGQTVVIDHGLGLFSLFAHLSAIDVHTGDAVTTGEVLGKVGATGRVTGPHLHWMVRVGGARIDPLSLLATLGG
jgi:murein DD-endopeptidase MepM/ murein hydrolase activator NlpD